MSNPNPKNQFTSETARKAQKTADPEVQAKKQKTQKTSQTEEFC